VLVEEIERMPDSVRTEAGLPRGLRRTGRFRAIDMPVYDSFEPIGAAIVPFAYVIPERMAKVIENLRVHGVTVDRVGELPLDAVDEFMVDSIVKAPQPSEGHRETRIMGRWVRSRTRSATRDWVVFTGQRLGRLAAYLLEPESDDGLVNWNYFDADLVAGSRYPVLRVHRSVR
jgi:hypothetical protein